MARRKMSKEEKKANVVLTINEKLLERLEENTDEKRSRLIERLVKEYVDKKDKI